MCLYILKCHCRKIKLKIETFQSKINLVCLYNNQAKHSDLTLLILEFQRVFKYLLINLNLHFLVNEVLALHPLLSNSSTLFLICSPHPFAFIMLVHSTATTTLRFETCIWLPCIGLSSAIRSLPLFAKLGN